ncbi:MAG: hypothetical protein OSJ58_10070 [Dysosmobacter sp.]|nr:hypothetical protein [Dysosmobacter sp.]
MKKVNKFISVCVMLLMLTASCLPVFAAMQSSSDTIVYLPPNQVWSKGYGASHDANYSRVGARCLSVYPTNSGPDLFSAIRCKVVDTLDITISKNAYVILNETVSAYTPISLAEGYLNTNYVYFKFCGNTNSNANAVVSYIGTYIGN